MKKIIVNADDYGKSVIDTDLIAECFDKGYIDRTTIMVNMPDVDRAKRIAVEKSFFNNVGLHLNLTEGTPLTEDIKKEPLFCDPTTGEFNKSFTKNTFAKFHLNKRCYLAVKKEVSAQIERFLSLGFTSNHLDSHHHIHKYLPILKAIIEVVEDKSWKSIRIADNVQSKGFALCYNNFVNKKLKRIKYLDTTDVLLADIKTASNFNNTLNCQNIEIVVHPKKGDNSKIYDKDIEINSIFKIKEALNS